MVVSATDTVKQTSAFLHAVIGVGVNHHGLA